MKIIYSFTCVFVLFCFSNKCFAAEAAQSVPKDIFHWDIEKKPNGFMMYLDVGYKVDAKDSGDTLTLAVAQVEGEPRPRFISFILPNNVVEKNGIFLSFLNGFDEKDENTKAIRVPFEKCSVENKTCTARVVQGYLKEDGQSAVVDVMKNFKSFNFLIVAFLPRKNLKLKSVVLPLDGFKTQYSNALKK